MLTRAGIKRKGGSQSTMAKRFKPSRPILKKKRKTRVASSPINSSISTDDDNLNSTSSSTEKDLLIIDQSKQVSNQSSTPKTVSCGSTNLNSTELRSNSLANQNGLTTTYEQEATKDAYRKLDEVILTCSPVVGSASTIAYENPSSTSVTDKGHAATISNSTSQITPITTRTVPPEKRQVDRSLVTVEGATTTVRTYSFNQNNLLSSPLIRSNGTIQRNSQAVQARSFSSGISIPTPTQHVRSSCSSISLAVLEQVPEYQKLKRELQMERKRCTTWAEDYNKIREEFERYRAVSFPRPTVDGLNFLLQLVDNLTLATTSIDTRSRGELARSFNLTEEQLNECHHLIPQRAALMLFSRLYPSYRARAELGSIKKFARQYVTLLNDIYIFARQCNPSTLYTMEKLKEALGASIRQANYQMKRFDGIGRQLFQEDVDVEPAQDDIQMNDDDLVMDFSNNDIMDCNIINR